MIVPHIHFDVFDLIEGVYHVGNQLKHLVIEFFSLIAELLFDELCSGLVVFSFNFVNHFEIVYTGKKTKKKLSLCG